MLWSCSNTTRKRCTWRVRSCVFVSEAIHSITQYYLQVYIIHSRSVRAWHEVSVEDAHVIVVEILVLRYSGFPHGTMGIFMVSGRILYHPAVPTFSLHFSIFCSLPLRDDVIYMNHFCVLYLEYPLRTYPGAAQDQGIGDTPAFLSLLQALESTRWYGLRRVNKSSREGV